LVRIKKQFQQLEEKISKLNLEKTKLEADLGLPEIYSDKQKFLEVENLYKQNTDQLAKFNNEYENLFEKMMVMEENVV